MKRHRGRLIAVAAAAVPVLTLTACAGSTSPASTQQPVNKVFTYDTTAPVMVDGWDPATEYSDGILAMSEMYETLTRYNSATNTVGPMLATSWSSADGGKTWTFHLRHGVYFHTGRPMTAQAAKASILRTIKLDGGAAYVWGAVKTIDTPDQYTLVFHLSYPSPLALQASADYSAYIYDTQGPAGQTGNAFTSWLNAGHDAGTGPYTVQTWNKGQEFEVYLKQFGKYWGGWSGSHLELSPLDTDAIARFLGEVGETADGVAITSVFAPVSARHELVAAELVKRELGETHVSLSHEIGSLGLLERENATILNGALAGVARDVVRGMQDALTAHGLRPETFFAQNDGTLMGLDQAMRYPVLTIGSGPANSVRGAAFLTGRSDALVADVGGTSTDIGMLINGFPRESSYGVEIGGIRTNFRMPDLVTIALGGGTVVAGGQDGVRVGPHSVGYRLRREALVFGGPTATLTDSAVAAGRAALGSVSETVRHQYLLGAALARADEMLADAIDRVKTSREDRPLIAVGGGSILVPDKIPGVSEVIRPEYFDAANAVGAAIASVSGQIDRIFHPGPGGRDAMLEEAREEARERAVASGADPETVRIVELEEIPLAYLTTPAVRVRVKAAGTLVGGAERLLARHQ